MNAKTPSYPKVIAEIGCNHKGDMAIAQEMIKIAAQFCKTDIVKFQKRTVRDLLTPEEYAAPHPNQYHAYGKTYGEHREFLEFDVEQHKQLKKWCGEWGVGYSCSVWDIRAAKEIASLCPGIIKVPSASNTDIEMLRWLIDNFKGEVHVSLGMTTRQEEARIVDLFDQSGRAGDLVLYACTSGYPVAFEDVCLLEVSRLRGAYGAKVRAIGYSGHHLGIAVDVAAITLGAGYIERHYTLDRTWKGTDHAASVEPDGMRRIVRDVNAVAKALSYKPVEILEVEVAQRKKLKRKING